MPVVKVYRHGGTVGVAPMTNNHERSKRDVVVGWSAGAVRRNIAFLRSIDERLLTGEGVALTLTLRDCPPSPATWHRLVRDYFRQVARVLAAGGYSVLRYHYVTEWQRRGVPHLHAALYVSDGSGASLDLVPLLKGIWKGYAGSYGVSDSAQWVLPITAVVGWNQYVSKHAARGVWHYQRSAASIPGSWRTGTGRMWGKSKEWPVKEPLRLEMDNRGFHVLRRWFRSWRIADARASIPVGFALLKDPKRTRDAVRRLVSARGCLRCNKRYLSQVRGVSEWIPEVVMLRMVERLHLDGYEVQS